MSENIYRIASGVGSPLALAGILCALFAQITLVILRGLTRVDAHNSVIVVKRVLNYFFILAVVAILLGAGGWAYAKHVDHDLAKSRRAEQIVTVGFFSGLVTALRTETDRLIDEYPKAYAELIRTGHAERDAKEELFGRDRRRIDEICDGYKVGSRVRATFPEFGWDLFFSQGKAHYLELRDAVHDAVLTGQYSERRAALRELQKDYLHHLEQRLDELRDKIQGQVPLQDYSRR